MGNGPQAVGLIRIDGAVVHLEVSPEDQNPDGLRAFGRGGAAISPDVERPRIDRKHTQRGNAAQDRLVAVEQVPNVERSFTKPVLPPPETALTPMNIVFEVIV